MLHTEIASPRYRALDTWDDADILTALLEGQLNAIAAVRAALPQLQQAAAAIVARLQNPRSRLVYIGAGASGHLALQDGMEMPTTYGWSAERLVLLMAGGDAARLSPDGSREDDASGGAEAIDLHAIGADDVIIAVAASGGTPYTVAALQAAGRRGALTIGIANNPDTALLRAADYPILLATGPEVIAGSTRLNAGTAQKAALGMLSTLVMVKLGHVIDGFMVNMTVDNAKLRERAVSILTAITDCDRAAALTALDHCQGQIKPAALVVQGLSFEQAQNLLQQTHGRLREALMQLSSR